MENDTKATREKSETVNSTTDAIDSSVTGLAVSENRAFLANSLLYFQLAAANGHTEVVRWLHEIGAQWNESALIAAAENGHWELMRWMYERNTEETATSEIQEKEQKVESGKAEEKRREKERE